MLVFAGLRIGELCALQWRHADLAAGWLTVSAAKTERGMRRVKVRGVVRDALLKIKPTTPNPDGYVFGTGIGRQPNPSMFSNRILSPAVAGERACG